MVATRLRLIDTEDGAFVSVDDLMAWLRLCLFAEDADGRAVVRWLMDSLDAMSERTDDWFGGMTENGCR